MGPYTDTMSKAESLCEIKRGCCSHLYLRVHSSSSFSVCPFFIFQAFHVESISLFISTSYHAFIMMFASVVPTPGGSGAAEFTFNGLFRPYMSAEQLVLSLLFLARDHGYLAVFIGVFLTGFSARKKEKLETTNH